MAVSPADMLPTRQKRNGPLFFLAVILPVLLLPLLATLLYVVYTTAAPVDPKLWTNPRARQLSQLPVTAALVTQRKARLLRLGMNEVEVQRLFGAPPRHQSSRFKAGNEIKLQLYINDFKRENCVGLFYNNGSLIGACIVTDTNGSPNDKKNVFQRLQTVVLTRRWMDL